MGVMVILEADLQLQEIVAKTRPFRDEPILAPPTDDDDAEYCDCHHATCDGDDSSGSHKNRKMDPLVPVSPRGANRRRSEKLPIRQVHGR